MKHYLAVDIGASSGRHIVGWMEGGIMRTEEVYRFPNGVIERAGHLTWDLKALEAHVRAGIDRARAAYPDLVSLSVDTWGVDYVLTRGGEALEPCYAYRDGRTEAVLSDVHAITPFETLYRHTGIQFQPFNTVYQLCADKAAGRLDDADGFLMIPCWLMYRLCGATAHEYTNATTTGLVSARTGEYDLELIDALGLPRRLFPTLTQPGAVIGTYEGIDVVLCATHDTASAVEGIPMEGDAPFISSGTWSLLGVKSPEPIITEASLRGNWANEGGVGYTRVLKNIMGMWLVNRLREELCPDAPFDRIVAMAEESSFDATVNADDAAFLAPKRMQAAFDAALGAAPRAPGDYFRCAYRSLAQTYRSALEDLARVTGRSYDRLYIVGGGAKNAFLNRLTEEASGLKVVALPIEATALGNLKIQMNADR